MSVLNFLKLSDLYPSSAEFFAQFQAGVHDSLQVSLQSPPEVSEHGGSSGEHDVLTHKHTVS